MEQDWQSEIIDIIRLKPSKPDLNEQEIQRLNCMPVDISSKVLREIFEKESDRFVKSRSFSALLNLSSFDTVQFLVETMKKAPVDWRIVCCERLGNYLDERAIAILRVVVLKDRNPDVRYTAVEALGKIGDLETVSTLKEVHQKDKGKDYEGFPISDAAVDALKAIHRRLLGQ